MCLCFCLPNSGPKGTQAHPSLVLCQWFFFLNVFVFLDFWTFVEIIGGGSLVGPLVFLERMKRGNA